MPVTQWLIENGYEDVVIFENPSYEAAFIGVTHDNRAVYAYEKMVQNLMEEDGMSEEDAIEFIDYNTIRSLGYQPMAPIIVYCVETISKEEQNDANDIA